MTFSKRQQNIGAMYPFCTYFEVIVWVAFRLFECIFRYLETVYHFATPLFCVMKEKKGDHLKIYLDLAFFVAIFSIFLAILFWKRAFPHFGMTGDQGVK